MVVAFLVSQTARLDKLSLGVRVREQFMSPLKSTRFSASPTVEVQVANSFAVAFEALRLTYRYEQTTQCLADYDLNGWTNDARR